MYRINRLHRPVLITPDEVLFHAPTDISIDERQLSHSIIPAEERFIANALCDAFYEDFIGKKNRLITKENREELFELVKASMDDKIVKKEELKIEYLPIGYYINAIEFVEDKAYLSLWNRFLWKLTAECVDLMLITPSWVRTTTDGQQKNNPETAAAKSSSAELKDVKFKIDNALNDRIDPLIERMRLWICQNKASFPLYCKPCNDCGCTDSNNDHNGVSYLRKSGFIFPKDKKDDCCIF